MTSQFKDAIIDDAGGMSQWDYPGRAACKFLSRVVSPVQRLHPDVAR